MITAVPSLRSLPMCNQPFCFGRKRSIPQLTYPDMVHQHHPKRACLPSPQPSSSHKCSLLSLPREMLSAIVSQVAMVSSPSTDEGATHNVIASNLQVMFRLFPMAAATPAFCAVIQSYLRGILRFDHIIFQLATTHPITLFFEHHTLTTAAHNAIHNMADLYHPDHLQHFRSTVSMRCHPLCHLVSSMMMFLHPDSDPSFKNLNLDILYEVLCPRAMLAVVHTITCMKPTLESFKLTPRSGYPLHSAAPAIIRMLNQTSSSIRRFSVYVPCDIITEALISQTLSLEALEDLHLVMNGEHVWQYDAAHTTNTIHLLFEVLRLRSPRLKRVTIESSMGGAYPIVKIERLPPSVTHLVVERDIGLLKLFDRCRNLPTITIQNAFIDFDGGGLLDDNDELPDLESFNFVGCTFKFPDGDELGESRRKVGCIRKIVSDRCTRANDFPVEGLLHFIGDCASLEVLELRLDSEADMYLCEVLGYVVSGLPSLKVLRLEVLETKLTDDKAEHFKELFEKVIVSDCKLEHLSLVNMWVRSDLVTKYMRKKGKYLKSFDVKMHSPSCSDEESDEVLKATEVFEVVRLMATHCEELKNVCLGHESYVRSMIRQARMDILNGCACVGERWETMMVLDEIDRMIFGFQRDKIRREVYQRFVLAEDEEVGGRRCATLGVELKKDARPASRREQIGKGK